MGKQFLLQRSTNRGWFRRGHDPRRHELTTEQRSRGGITRWRMTMAEVRVGLNLPLPSPALQEAARLLLERRRQELEHTRKELGL